MCLSRRMRTQYNFLDIYLLHMVTPSPWLHSSFPAGYAIGGARSYTANLYSVFFFFSFGTLPIVGQKEGCETARTQMGLYISIFPPSTSPCI